MDDPLHALFTEHLAAIGARTARALAAAGYDGLLIPAGLPPVPVFDDDPYPFRANPHFRLWSPQAEPGSCLVLRPGERPQLLFHQPADYWHQPPALPDAPWTRAFALEVLREPEELRRFVEGGRRWALVGDRHPAWEGLGEHNAPALVNRLDYDRAAKTAYEVECLARASELAAGAHVAAAAAFRAGASEYGIHAEYLRAASLAEDDLPYRSIVALDRHAAVLHYQHLERSTAAPARSFLLDAGATWAGYASDITRTWARGPGAFADLVAALDAEQQALASSVRPGVDYRSIHLAAHEAVARVLEGAGLLRCSPATAVEAGVSRTLFPHGIGHLLGLQVHDVGGLMAGPEGGERPRPEGHPFLRLTRDLGPGFLVTIEPGIYFIDLLLQEAARDARRALVDWYAVEQLRPCGGVRIEDDVVALPRGPRNLTREAFSRLSC
jgi:Xaa-Pro dipeptidase